jgi:excisionase family DNA binding protein
MSDATGYRLMTVKEASAYLGIPESTLRMLQTARRIPFVRTGRIYFEREKLDEWVAAHRIEPLVPKRRSKA